nr:ribonuclease H-like domain-containing protein [Tanacetum cinerariifolium]
MSVHNSEHGDDYIEDPDPVTLISKLDISDPRKKKLGQNFKGKNVSNSNYVGTSSSSGFTDEQMATLISLIKDNKIGKNVQANMADFKPKLVRNGKIVDSRANQHTDNELDNVLDISHLKIKDSGTRKNDTTNVFQDINHINFFDNEYPEMPNDDERVDPNLNSDNKSQSDSQSKSDYSLYTKSDSGVFLALFVYVDDIIITGNNNSEIEKFKVYLKSKFMIKDLGNIKYFLGIEVINTDKGICLNQRKYVLDLLSEYGMLTCKPTKTFLMAKPVIFNEASESDPILENITDYQKLMGKLIYLNNTRPDISYVVHCLSQFMYSPLTSHLKTAFRILRYLKSCPGLGIHIIKDSGMNLKAFSDVDWAKCVVTKKSVTGYCVFCE